MAVTGDGSKASSGNVAHRHRRRTVALRPGMQGFDFPAGLGKESSKLPRHIRARLAPVGRRVVKGRRPTDINAPSLESPSQKGSRQNTFATVSAIPDTIFMDEHGSSQAVIQDMRWYGSVVEDGLVGSPSDASGAAGAPSRTKRIPGPWQLPMRRDPAEKNPHQLSKRGAQVVRQMGMVQQPRRMN